MRWSLLIAFAFVACAAPKEPPHVLYETDAASLNNPFPDLRNLADTGYVMRPNWYQPFLPHAALNRTMREFLNGYAASAATEVHGLGNFGSTMLLASEPVDLASAPGTVARLRKAGD